MVEIDRKWRMNDEYTVVSGTYDQGPENDAGEYQAGGSVIELVDARVPLSSRNPDIDDLGRNKARLLLLNKSDLADEAANEAWSAYFRAKGFQVVKLNSRSGAGFKSVNAAVQEACKEKIERDRRRGILNRPVRAMVAGTPNVGKSTFINSFAGRPPQTWQ